VKIKQLCVPLAALCAIATEAGCVSVDHQMSQSSFEAMNLKRDERLSPTEFSQPLMLDEYTFERLGLNTNGTGTLDEWQCFDTSAGPKGDFSALDVNGHGQINTTEFLTQTPKDSKRYRFFGGTNPTDEGFSLSDAEEFQQQGWQLFSFHF